MHKPLLSIFFICLMLLFGFVTSTVIADENKPLGKSPDVAADPKVELEAAFQAANTVLQKGPNQISIAEQATLKLPADYGYVPINEARRLMLAMGNHPGEGFQGMIFPLSDQHGNWFIVLSYTNAGYVKDDDAKNWNADELLENIKSGTERENAERRTRGIPEMEVIGWVEKPLYDTVNQRLVWSISSRDKGQENHGNHGINYNTLALGREGFMSMNLVTDMQAIEELKPVAKSLLAALSYHNGKRYADYDATTDKVAAYGLAALVAGVAAKKLGLIAILIAFFAKFAKIIILAVVASIGVAVQVFRKRKKDTTGP